MNFPRRHYEVMWYGAHLCISSTSGMFHAGSQGFCCLQQELRSKGKP